MTDVALGALIVSRRVLLGLRRPEKRVNPDAWDLPGGVVEPGESELDALVRELHEELGVRVDAVSCSHLCRVTLDIADDRTVLSVWQVRGWRGTPVHRAHEEHVELAWHGADELPPLVHPVIRGTVLAALT